MTIKYLIIFGNRPEDIIRANIITYLVAQKEFKTVRPALEKIILFFS